MPADIPGFYWDEERKKYFKVMANASMGSQHPHSMESLRKRAKLEDHKAMSNIQKTTRRRRLYLLDFELSHTLSKSVNFDSHMYHFVRPEKSMAQPEWTSGQIVAISQVDNALIVAYQHQISAHKIAIAKGQKTLIYKASDDFYATHSRIISMDASDQTTTALALGREQSTLVSLHNRQNMQTNDREVAVHGHIQSVDATAMCAVAISGQEASAFGRKDSLQIRYHDSEGRNTAFVTGSAVLAMQALPDNRLLAGCRDGTIHLISQNSGLIPHRVMQTSCKGIGNLHLIGRHHVLVTGVANAAHLYDLRCMVEWTRDFLSLKGRPRKINLTQQVPLVIYNGHVNEALVPPMLLGFAVNPSQTLVVAAGEDHTIRIWTITGKLIQSMQAGNSPIQAIFFDHDWNTNEIKDRMPHDRPGIWVGNGATLEWWSST